MRSAYEKIATGLKDAIAMQHHAWVPVGEDTNVAAPVDIGGGSTGVPPHADAASHGAREIIAFLKGAGYDDWKASRIAQADTRAWRLTQIAAGFMAADRSAGFDPDPNEMLDRAQELMAEADRRLAEQDGSTT